MSPFDIIYRIVSVICHEELVSFMGNPSTIHGVPAVDLMIGLPGCVAERSERV